jgi:hypothetical protein
MLWLKAWLEVRYRLVFSLIVLMAPLVGLYVNGASSPDAGRGVIGLMGLEWMFCSVFLAGAGIRTQSPLQGTKGLHGSTHFTLALPVTRLRLITVRASLGVIAMAGMILVSGGAAWALFPMLRAHATALDLARWLFAAGCCVNVFHAISIFAATMFDEFWHVWATVSSIGLLKWLSSRFPPPPPFDLFRAIADGPSLVRHAMPWPAIALSFLIAGSVFAAAVKVAQEREY